ncbi:colanic acid biosynthesis protein [Enterococcus casseliflavus]|uniref:polysaccharide pyruvyl transferase family protein n=1 Tax=Enterococcus casseliflavus TaxID=37734 RepID=UPI000DF8FD0E|nr:polysaccharide pyruvyl transferase family protein [Enterococcus casseliflavus]GEB27119.1 colanic acid biosynthesis pyruvyl transferase WcaK [Enterococcus casseliflavus]STP34204.1 colanic acid biosynthesis protein [Enterococcus casseliflavus]
MDVTIISAYTWYNKGDAAILLGTVKELEEYFYSKNKVVNFNILSFTPEIDYLKYSEHSSNIKFVKSNIFNPYPLKKDKKNKLKAILKMGLKFFQLELSFFFNKESAINKVEGLKLCNKSDLVIVCGGGFLGGNKYNSLMHLAQIHFVNKLDKKIILWGTSIEPPTKKLLKSITEKVLINLDYILPRETVTEEYLDTWFPKDKIVRTPDMAFKTPFEKTSFSEEIFLMIKNIAKDKDIIGITMREWMFPKSENPTDDKKKYIEALVNLINMNSEKKVFVFIPQVIMEGDDDRKFAFEVQKQLNNKESLIVLEQDFSPYELKWLISQFDQFVGTRMHSNIFSSTMLLPPIAIAYESKTNGIMDELGLSKYCVDIENVHCEVLDKLIKSNSHNKKELSNLMETKIEQFQLDIRKATKEVLDK